MFVFCFVMHYFVSFLVCNHLEWKRELVVLLLLSWGCLVAVYALWLFLAVPWVGLQCVIVVFPDHTHFEENWANYPFKRKLYQVYMGVPGEFNWVRCTINRSHSTPCKKAEFEHLQIFPGHCLDFFLSVSGKICYSPIKKVKRQPTLIISFSQHSPFFGEQSKNPG